MVYDFDGDSKAELMFKTAPGTKTIPFDKKGKPKKETYITLLREDCKAGITHTVRYEPERRDDGLMWGDYGPD